jgi:uncharacterized protein
MNRLLLLLGLAPAFAQPKPRIAVVIDDFGLTYPKNVKDEEWQKIAWPVTFAVMPESPRTRKSAEETAKNGHELIVHFPFDPFLSLKLDKQAADPEDVKKVAALLEKSLKQIPGPVGLNNHRSYYGTMNRPLMEAFMRLLKPKGLYFLDSKVSPKTVAYEEAKKAGIPAAINTIFLDEAKVHDKPFCTRMLRRGAALARKHGSAIVIGHHYFHGTFECLRDEVPKLQAEGFDFVFASALLVGPKSQVELGRLPSKRAP